MRISDKVEVCEEEEEEVVVMMKRWRLFPVGKAVYITHSELENQGKKVIRNNQVLPGNETLRTYP